MALDPLHMNLLTSSRISYCPTIGRDKTPTTRVKTPQPSGRAVAAFNVRIDNGLKSSPIIQQPPLKLATPTCAIARPCTPVRRQVSSSTNKCGIAINSIGKNCHKTEQELNGSMLDKSLKGRGFEPSEGEDEDDLEDMPWNTSTTLTKRTDLLPMTYHDEMSPRAADQQNSLHKNRAITPTLQNKLRSPTIIPLNRAITRPSYNNSSEKKNLIHGKNICHQAAPTTIITADLLKCYRIHARTRILYCSNSGA